RAGVRDGAREAPAAHVGLRRPGVADRHDRARDRVLRLRVVLVGAHAVTRRASAAARSSTHTASRTADTRTRASRPRAAPGGAACGPASPGGSAGSGAGSPRASRTPRAGDSVGEDHPAWGMVTRLGAAPQR